MDREIRRKYAEILRLQSEITQLEVERRVGRGNAYSRKRTAYGFPFDQLETVIRGGLALVEASVRKGVDALFDRVDRLRKR
jgi:hypothetical protein